MKNTLLLVGLIALVGAYTYYDARMSPPAPIHRNEAVSSAPAPLFSFTDLKGKTHRLVQFKGKVVLINFWASWCAPCVIEFPQMIDLAKATAEETVFLFISIDDDKKDISHFLKKSGAEKLPANVYIAHDKERKIADLFQTYKIPETYILDKNLAIAEKIIGADVDWTGQDMHRKIRNLYQN